MDAQKLLNEFPEEIWQMILQNVTDYNHIENLAESSPFFKTRLDQHRVIYLFKRALPILYPILHIELTKDLDSFQKLPKEDFLRVCEQRDYEYGLCICCGRRKDPTQYSGILVIRLVCKPWCAGFDSFCENLESKFEMMDADIKLLQKEDSIEQIENLSEVELLTSKKIRAFMKHFRDSHGNGQNPFIGRSIVISWKFDNPVCKFGMETAEKIEDEPSSDSESDIEWDDSFSVSSESSDDFDPEGNPTFDLEEAKLYNNQVLLKTYGDHVWYCTIDIFDNKVPSQECCAWLIQMLKFMPNLKVLRLLCDYVDFDDSDNWDCYYKDEWIENCMNGNQFPKLNSLEYLSGRNLSKIFIVNIIKQNSNLKQLELLGYMDTPLNRLYGFENLNLIGGSLKKLGLLCLLR